MKFRPVMAALAIALVIAGSASADPVLIHALLWTDGEGQSLNHALEAGIEDFEQSHQGKLKVHADWVTPEQADGRLDTLVASGSAPDVLMTDAVSLRRRVTQGLLLPLDASLSADPAWRDRFPSPLLELLKNDGRVYAVPIAQTSVFLYANNKIFREHGLTVPRTWDDLKKAVRVLSSAGITPVAFSNKEGWEGVLLSQLLAIRIAGPDLFGGASAGRLDLNDPGLLEAATAAADLARSGAFPAGFESMTDVQAIEMFRQGKAGMLISRDRLFATLNFSGSAVKNNVSIAAFPLVTGGKGDPEAWLVNPDFDLAVIRGSANKESAVEFIKTYMTDDLQQHFGAHVFLPVTRTGLDPSQLVPLQRTAVELLGGVTRAALFLDQVLSPDKEAHYADSIRAILAGTPAKDTLAGLQKWWDSDQ